MIDLRKQIETLIEKAAGADTASAAMQYAQAAANAANTVCSMDQVGMFKMPEEISETALDRLLELARRSPTRSTQLPTKFNVKAVPMATSGRPDFVPGVDSRNVST